MIASRVAMLAAYVTAGLLTFGYIVNRIDCVSDPLPRTCQASAEIGAVIGGISWPAYWAAKAAIYVTK